MNLTEHEMATLLGLIVKANPEQQTRSTLDLRVLKRVTP